MNIYIIKLTQKISYASHTNISTIPTTMNQKMKPLQPALQGLPSIDNETWHHKASTEYSSK